MHNAPHLRQTGRRQPSATDPAMSGGHTASGRHADPAVRLRGYTGKATERPACLQARPRLRHEIHPDPPVRRGLKQLKPVDSGSRTHFAFLLILDSACVTAFCMAPAGFLASVRGRRPERRAFVRLALWRFPRQAPCSRSPWQGRGTRA